MRHELEVFLGLKIMAIRSKGKGCLYYVLGVTAGTNKALACGKGSYSSCSARLYGFLFSMVDLL